MPIDTVYSTDAGIVEQLLVIFADSECNSMRASDPALLRVASDNMHLFDLTYITKGGKWNNEFIVSLRNDAPLSCWAAVITERVNAVRQHRQVFFPEYA